METLNILRDFIPNENLLPEAIEYETESVVKEALREIGVAVPTCGACMSNMAIAPNGDVVPCQSWLGEDASVGNILRDALKLLDCQVAAKLLNNYNVGAAISLVMMVLILISLAVMNKFSDDDEEGGMLV